jgi:hypothetical protein
MTGVVRVRVMVFNATFNNISVISSQSVLLMEESGVAGESHRSSPRFLVGFVLLDL